MALGWGRNMGPGGSPQRHVVAPAFQSDTLPSVQILTTKDSHVRSFWRRTHPSVFSSFCAKVGGSHKDNIPLSGVGRSIAILSHELGLVSLGCGHTAR